MVPWWQKLFRICYVFLWLSVLHLNGLLTQNSFKHFSIHKVNSRVCFITKQSSSWCKELHEKWSYQWIMRLPAFMESSLEVILSLLNADHGIKIVIFLVWCCVVYQACSNILEEPAAFISAWRLRQQFQWNCWYISMRVYTIISHKTISCRRRI